MKLTRRLLTFFLLTSFIVITFGGCNQDGKIPFDPKTANRHIRPLNLLKGYIKSFAGEKQVLSKLVRDTGYLNRSFNMPTAEMFNRDAIIALLNAPGAKNVRIYLGRNDSGHVVFVLLPADEKGNDLGVNLSGNGRRTALNIPGISSAQAKGTEDFEGVEDGQRCPYVCSTVDLINQ